MIQQDGDREARLGVFYGVTAYTIWGLSAIYWKFLMMAGPLEVLAHRVLWGAVFMGGVLAWRRRLPMIWQLLRDPKTLKLLALTGGLLGINWTLFVWTVMSGQVLQASLGYYINPLVNVAFGTLLLSESMRNLQKAAVVLAGVGVLAMVVMMGTLPWPALVLAVTFAVYGYLRKTANVVAFDALFVEMLIFVPVALGALMWFGQTGASVFGPHEPLLTLLLIGGGLVTLAPLALFGEAVRRVRLVTIGFMQYVAPTIQFALAVFVFGETFSTAHMAAFGLIWVALALYSLDAVRQQSRG